MSSLGLLSCDGIGIVYEGIYGFGVGFLMYVL